MKTFPKIGDKLYLSNYYCGTRDPYTVVCVTNSTVVIQGAKLIFFGVRYFDTLADKIVEDKSGNVIKLHWKPTLERWGESGRYGRLATFGEYDYLPYID